MPIGLFYAVAVEFGWTPGWLRRVLILIGLGVAYFVWNRTYPEHRSQRYKAPTKDLSGVREAQSTYGDVARAERSANTKAITWAAVFLGVADKKGQAPRKRITNAKEEGAPETAMKPSVGGGSARTLIGVLAFPDSSELNQSPEQRSAITPEVRHRKIAEAAYLKAESRGFQGDSPEQDWYEAVAEIDAMFSLNNQDAASETG